MSLREAMARVGAVLCSLVESGKWGQVVIEVNQGRVKFVNVTRAVDPCDDGEEGLEG